MSSHDTSDQKHEAVARAIGPDAAIAWLNDAARYFENRPTVGEDAAHWANVYNAENCRKIAAAIAAYEAVTAESGMEWQPIETAPKDGTNILVYGPHGHGILVVSREPEDRDFNPEFPWDTLDGPAYPATCFTHWRPLPAPPAAKEPADG